MNLMRHPLHHAIGEIIANRGFPDRQVFRDPACGGAQHIPLFISASKSRRTQYCNVDLLILQRNLVRVVIEIEETDIKPTQVCGKFLTSALSSHFIHEVQGNTPIGMGSSVVFIQIVDASKLKDRTAKLLQFENLEKSIQGILPLRGSRIDKYRLFVWNPAEAEAREAELLKYLEEVLLASP